MIISHFVINFFKSPKAFEDSKETFLEKFL